ncbi:MAG: hypothetical protein WC326_12685 [Candidatus Delongbacteria bacterium]
MNRAQCIKCRPWPLILLAGLAGLAPAAPGAALRSSRARDPWLHAAWSLDSLPGPAVLFEGGLAARRAGFWLGSRRLYGLRELSSVALAGVLPTEWGSWQAGGHLLTAGEWQEGQFLLDWQPPGTRPLQVGAGLELRRVAAGDWSARAGWLRALADWRQGPLRLGGCLALPLPGSEPIPECRVSARSLAAGWRLTRTWALAWAWEQEGTERSEQLGLVWETPGQGLAATWRTGRGWELAGRLRWRTLSLSASWWSHPVLPPTPAWGLTWQREEP